MNGTISATGNIHIQGGSLHFEGCSIISGGDTILNIRNTIIIGHIIAGRTSILPKKALLNIVSYLNINDVFSLRASCKEFNLKIDKNICKIIRWKLPSSILEKLNLTPKKQNENAGINVTHLNSSCEKDFTLKSQKVLLNDGIIVCSQSPDSPPCEIEFPNEMLMQIFSNLGIPNLCKVMLVCKTWKDLAEDITLWKNHLPASFHQQQKYKSRYIYKPLHIYKSSEIVKESMQAILSFDKFEEID